MTDAGLIVLCSFISPFRAERRLARDIAARGRVRRDLRRHAARDGHRARSEGPLQARAGRRDQELHRRRPALRSAGSAGTAARNRRRHRRRARRPGDRRTRGARPHRETVTFELGARTLIARPLRPRRKTRFDAAVGPCVARGRLDEARRAWQQHRDVRESFMRSAAWVSFGLAALLLGSTGRLGQDPGLLLGGQSGEFPARDQHDRHQLRRLAADLQPPDRIQARHDRGRPGPRRKLGHRRRRQDDHLPSAQGREVAFGQGLQADARLQRRRRAVLVQPAVEGGQPLSQGLRRQIRLLQRHGHAVAARHDREEGRLHRRLPSEGPERRDPRQSRDGFRLDRLGRICRFPAEEGHAGAVRPGSRRHRPVLLRRLSEGRGDPLQEEPRLFRREGAGRRSRVRDHARRRPRATPSCKAGECHINAYPRPADLAEMQKDSDAEGDQRVRPQRRLSGRSTRQSRRSTRRKCGRRSAWRSTATRS